MAARGVERRRARNSCSGNLIPSPIVATDMRLGQELAVSYDECARPPKVHRLSVQRESKFSTVWIFSSLVPLADATIRTAIYQEQEERR